MTTPEYGIEVRSVTYDDQGPDRYEGASFTAHPDGDLTIHIEGETVAVHARGEWRYVRFYDLESLTYRGEPKSTAKPHSQE